VIRAWMIGADGVLQSPTPDEAAAAAAEGTARIWIDFADEPEHCADQVLTRLDIHPLVREDMVVQINRPKVDNYGSYLYLVMHAASWDGDRPVLHEIDILLADRFLITYHDGSPHALQAAHDILPRRPELLRDGPVHLLHFVLDTLVDGYLPIMDDVTERLDHLEEDLFTARHQPSSRSVLMLKRGLSAMRRVVGPQRDTLLALTRDEFQAIPAEIRPYLRDVYDRLARISDLLDSFRDEGASLLELHTALSANRLNEVIKRLTVIATIGLPLTIVTSWYGMNFDFAEYHFHHPWLYAAAISSVVAALTWWLLKRSKWL